MTSLTAFVFKNDPVGLRKALADGADPYGRDGDGRTPLIHAAIDNRLEVANELLDSGVQVDAQDQLGNSALHYAAQGDHLEMARLLIDKGGANVDVVEIHGNTPLWRAVFNFRGRGELILALLKAGADQNRKNKHGKSPLDLADTIANYDIRQFFE
jgi:ankyrin repeat protein